MAKLYLKLEQKVLREYTLGEAPVTIGRAPDNTIQIEDLTVSGHHACIDWKGWRYVVEDRSSLNGTYLNKLRVDTAELSEGDVLQVGRHAVVFEAKGEETKVEDVPVGEETAVEAAPPPLTQPDPEATQEEVNQLAQPPIQSATPQRPRERLGTLTVVKGELEESEYTLFSILTVIGKSDVARIKLKGWFAPKVAANITRRDGKYVIAAGDKSIRIKINGEPILVHRELKDYDTIEVAGITFSFTYKD